MARKFIVSGTVQGVFFRASTQTIAEQLGITGWVHNKNDGTVEVHAQGIKESLDTLECWLQSGPPCANVTNLDITNIPDENVEGFKIF